MRLLNIRDTVQQVAEAVAAVLKVEVEIADEHLMRVAGTGKAQMNVLRTMAGEDHVYQSALRTGEPLIIQNPGFNEICKPCMHYGNCRETGEICCPIQVDGKGIGVIGLLAFDMEQRKRLFEDVEVIMNFLRKISDLLASKLKEYEVYQNQQATLKQLETVMNYLDQGVIAVDHQGQMIHCNFKSKQQLGVDKIEIDEEFQNNLIRIREMAKDSSSPIEISLTVKGDKKQFVVSRTPIVVNNHDVGAVITIDDLNKMVNLARRFQGENGKDPFSAIIGNSQMITTTKEHANRVAQNDSTIIIQGESGTGKEVFARAIHMASHRRKNTFMSINCAAIPEHLLESELFGYEDGAFTGARKGGKVGKFELSDGGTLFLDEIGDMPLNLQVKLLRVLQEKQVERVGATRGAKSINVRVIAATHRNLEEMVARRLFREDLYYRLNVILLHIPPLRQRSEDVLTIANHYLHHYSNLMNKEIRGITLEAQNKLIGYDWPGNVRELANAIEYAVNMEASSFITVDHLPKRVREHGRVASDDNPIAFHYVELNLKTLEKNAIETALKRVLRENLPKEKAAELLGISRATLFRKMKEYREISF